MSELSLTLLRLGYLALLWLLVLSVAAVMRSDIFGTRVTRRASTPAAAAAGGQPSAPAPSSRGRQSRDDRRSGPRTLVVTEGSLQGTTLALSQAPVLVGRAPECTLVLEDDFASSRHARFFLQDGTWYVEDLGSTNGTFLGKSRLSAPTPLGPGVPVRIGRTVFELRR